MYLTGLHSTTGEVGEVPHVHIVDIRIEERYIAQLLLQVVHS